MKSKFYLICIVCLAFVTSSFAQVPQGIPYQAAARNASGQPLVNTAVKVRFSIIDSVTTGTTVYQETHSVTTNNVGLFNVNVGLGTPVTGTFSGINWGQNFKFMKVELDPSGSGSNYVDMGSQQMMSVPYALYAGNMLKNNSGNAILNSHGQILIWGNTDTIIVFNRSALVEILGVSGQGGTGSTGCVCQGSPPVFTNCAWPGGAGGSALQAKFIIYMTVGDSLHIITGVDGQNAPNFGSCGGAPISGGVGSDLQLLVNRKMLVHVSGGIGGTPAPGLGNGSGSKGADGSLLVSGEGLFNFLYQVYNPNNSQISTNQVLIRY